ncbi:MAG TPA: glycosyltransferase [Sphingomicrobium sp.]
MAALWNAAISFVKSAQIILKERPDVLISEGAGAMYFIVLWARLFGACIIILESFARFEAPSLFGRLAAPLAHHMIAYAEPLRAFYPKATIFEPVRVLDEAPPAKQDLVFVTVGATLPFDRMVRMAAQAQQDGNIPERLLIQTGVGGAAPAGVEVVESLPFDQVQQILDQASVVICHGGTGSLITALSKGCHVIATPRLAALAEHYDDHQAEITEAFARRGLIQVANTVDELKVALTQTRTRDRVVATSDPGELIAFIEGILSRGASRWKRPA